MAAARGLEVPVARAAVAATGCVECVERHPSPGSGPACQQHRHCEQGPRHIVRPEVGHRFRLRREVDDVPRDVRSVISLKSGLVQLSSCCTLSIAYLSIYPYVIITSGRRMRSIRSSR